MSNSSTLAIEGGVPSVPKDIVDHDWERFRKSTQEEIDAVVSVLKGGHLSIAQGFGMPEGEALQDEFAEWVGSKYCLAVSSGTSSLHCAVAGVGIEPGDEVLVPAYTFIASAMVILHHNAIPVFVDIDSETFLIDPDKLQDKINEKTKAIMAVHIFGLPADMDQINKIAAKHGLKVIEDSAQAYGATYNGRKTGSLGDAAGFAMTTTKHLMVGEGGLLTTNDQEVFERASMLRLFGEQADMRASEREYIHHTIGWNYKLSEMSAALARVKLRHLDGYVNTLQENCEYLTERLKNIDGLIVPKVPVGRTHAYYMYPVKVDSDKLGMSLETGKLRDAVLNALAMENVRAGQWLTKPIPAQQLFQDKVAYGKGCPWDCHSGENVNYDVRDYPNTVSLIESSFAVRGLSEPNGIEIVDRYVQAFEKVFNSIDRVVELFDQRDYSSPKLHGTQKIRDN